MSTIWTLEMVAEIGYIWRGQHQVKLMNEPKFLRERREDLSHQSVSLGKDGRQTLATPTTEANPTSWVFGSQGVRQPLVNFC